MLILLYKMYYNTLPRHDKLTKTRCINFKLWLDRCVWSTNYEWICCCFCLVMFLLLYLNYMFKQLFKATEVCKVKLRWYEWHNIFLIVVWHIKIDSSMRKLTHFWWADMKYTRVLPITITWIYASRKTKLFCKTI